MASTLPWLPTALDQIALSSVKQGTVTRDNTLILMGSIFGGIAYYQMGTTMKTHGLSGGNALWNILSTVSGVVIGCYLFKEEITERKALGIGLGILSLWLIDGVKTKQPA